MLIQLNNSLNEKIESFDLDANPFTVGQILTLAVHGSHKFNPEFDTEEDAKIKKFEVIDISSDLEIHSNIRFRHELFTLNVIMKEL